MEATGISAFKTRSIPEARLRKQCHERGTEQWDEIPGVHGGALGDFGSDFNQRSLAPQCGQIGGRFTVGNVFLNSMSASRYLATASRFFLFGAISP